MSTRALRLTLSSLMLMSLSLLASGCAILGFASAVASGPDKVDAKFAPASRPTAIVVDSYRTKVPVSSFRDSLSSLLQNQLQEHKIVPLVDGYKVYDLRQRAGKAYHDMKVDEIGRAVGAEQVIYVDILRAETTAAVGNQLVKGGMVATIKVIDAKTGRTLWPKDVDDGYTFAVETKFATPEPGTSFDTVQEIVARQAADEIAKLFYKHSVEE